MFWFCRQWLDFFPWISRPDRPQLYLIQFCSETLSVRTFHRRVLTSSAAAPIASLCSLLHVFFVALSSSSLSLLILSLVPSSWLEYWWNSLWIWLKPHSAESDRRHKYLRGKRERTTEEKNQWEKNNSNTASVDHVSSADENQCDLTTGRVTQHVSFEEADHYVIKANFIFPLFSASLLARCLAGDERRWWFTTLPVIVFSELQTPALKYGLSLCLLRQWPPFPLVNKGMFRSCRWVSGREGSR